MNFPSTAVPEKKALRQAPPPARRSVRTVLLWLVLACLLPGVIGATVLFIFEYRAGLAQQQKDTIQTARALVQAVDNQILRVQALAQGLASSEALTTGNLAGFHVQARRALTQSRQGITVAVADADGQQVVNTGVECCLPLPIHGSPETIRRVFATGEPAVSNIFTSTILHRPIMAVAVPVVLDGQVILALSVNVRPEEFDGILAAQGLPAGWVATIFDGAGTIAARSRESERFVGQKPAEDYFRQLMAADEGTFEAFMKDGEAVVAAYTRSPVTDWRVSIGIPREALTAGLVRRLAFLALGIAALFAIGLGLARFMGSRIARSFQALVAPAFALGAGDRMAVPRVDVREAAEVAGALGQAAQLLQERTARLEESNRSLREKDRELAEAHRLARFGTWYWDLKSGEVAVSDSVREIYGRDVPSFPEQRGTLLTEESWEKLNAAAREAAHGNGYDLELQARHGSGALLWINAKGQAIRGADGAVAALRGTIQDITRAKEVEAEIQRLNAELEERVQQRTLQLEEANEALMRSNMELQRFAHAAAHDLQTPLRSIVGFTQLLQRELQSCVDTRAEEWLAAVIDNAKRLHTLIRELLAYSRLEAEARPREPVDLGEVFAQVLSSLATPIAEAGAEVSGGELPVVLADRSQMAQLLQNLVENGIKYNRSRPPRVRASAEKKDGEWIVAVADNGIGIAPRHHERIFEIFRRLHNHSQVPGSGIGLAICQRIVEGHGGRIWLESEAGRGSTFYFSLPAGDGKPGSVTPG